MIFPRI